MGNDYGGVITTKSTNVTANIEETIRSCVICNEQWPKLKQIKPHIARKHDEFGKHEYLNCPQCPGNFKDLQTLNRNIYINKVCDVIKLKINDNTIDWEEVWKDICKKNKYE